jgi:hypothetical protein
MLLNMSEISRDPSSWDIPVDPQTQEYQWAISEPSTKAYEQRTKAELMKRYGPMMIAFSEELLARKASLRIGRQADVRGQYISSQILLKANLWANNDQHNRGQLFDFPLLRTQAADANYYVQRTVFAVAPAFDDSVWLGLSAANKLLNQELISPDDINGIGRIIAASTSLPANWGVIAANNHEPLQKLLAVEGDKSIDPKYLQVTGNGTDTQVSFIPEVVEAIQRHKSPLHGCPAHMHPASDGVAENMQHQLWSNVVEFMFTSQGKAKMPSLTLPGLKPTFLQ